MKRWIQCTAVLAGAVAIAGWTAAPAAGAGFGIFEQGSKAMGMAGAFTAQADDPSALFHNAGGLAFVTEQGFSVGFTAITFAKADFQGGEPFPGSDYSAKQKTLFQTPPHVYWVRSLNERWKFGLGFNTPYGLETNWKNPETFEGRYLSTKAALRTFDFNPSLGWQVSDRFGIGFGAIVRFSDIELNRFVPQVDPFTFRVVDVAKVKLDSGFERGYGWNLGILHRYNESFSWGFSYRSRIKVDYDGKAHFTQIPTGNPVLDAVIASRLPFTSAAPVATSIEFPDMASLGVAIALGPTMVLEADANWTGWSSFDKVAIAIENRPDLSSTLDENWDNAYNYRLGLRWNSSAGSQWRFGLVLDQTPQPDEHVSPLLPDSDRLGYTVGFGHALGGNQIDLALMYLPFDDRTTTTNSDNFNGTYKTQAWLFGATYSF
ncbi:MAG: outer membrane protein transport protein [Thermoanaerobaculia bacterium]